MRRWGALSLVLFVAACTTGSSPPPSAGSAPAGGAPATGAALDRGTILALVEPAGSVDPAGGVIAAPIAGGLELVCRIGRPPADRQLTDQDLPALGLTRDGVVALARANLVAGLRPIGEVAPPVPPGQIGTIAGDYAEASRLVAHEEWTGLSQALGGHLLVAVPANDTLLYTKGGVPGALLTLASMARATMAKSPHPVSDEVLRWTPGGWEVVAKATAAAPRPGL
jgi:hypothetical protein